jgi:hypothetical protein
VRLAEGGFVEVRAGLAVVKGAGDNCTVPSGVATAAFLGARPPGGPAGNGAVDIETRAEKAVGLAGAGLLLEELGASDTTVGCGGDDITEAHLDGRAALGLAFTPVFPRGYHAAGRAGANLA